MKEKIGRVVTFAAPKLGNEKFVSAYDNLLGDVTQPYRIPGDRIPHLPPDRFGFRHVAAERTIELQPAGAQPSGAGAHCNALPVQGLERLAPAEKQTVSTTQPPVFSHVAGRSWTGRQRSLVVAPSSPQYLDSFAE